MPVAKQGLVPVEKRKYYIMKGISLHKYSTNTSYDRGGGILVH